MLYTYTKCNNIYLIHQTLHILSIPYDMFRSEIHHHKMFTIILCVLFIIEIVPTLYYVTI